MKSPLVLGLVALGLAILVPLAPHYLYDDEHAQRPWDNHKPTTVLVMGANSDMGMACIQDLIVSHAGGEALVIVLGCYQSSRSVDIITSRNCHEVRDQVLNQLGTGTEEVTLLPVSISIDLEEDISNSNHSVVQFAVQLQQVLPKSADYTVPPLHLLIFAGMATPLSHRRSSSSRGVEPHVHMNHLVPALLTHHIWKNALAVHEHDLDRKARLVVVSTGWSLFSVETSSDGWSSNQDTALSHGSLDPLWRSIDIMKHYSRAKQAHLLFAAELQARYSKSITVGASHTGYTRCSNTGSSSCYQELPAPMRYLFLLADAVVGMSPAQGVQSITLAAWDETAQYVGPKWFLFGPPVVVSRASYLSAGSVHHQAFSPKSSADLFDATKRMLNIAEFGKKTYQTM